MSVSRRTLLGGGAAILGTAGLGVAARYVSQPEWPSAETHWGWHLDADGNGVVDTDDAAIVRAALGSRRGRGLDPLPGWDPRADVLATGAVDPAHVAAVEAYSGRRLPVRPMVVCFHYGWYRSSRRRGGAPTMRYRGGNYASSSRPTEERFNRLKNEFGLGADLLSWIDNEAVRGAYERGYLAASNLSTRRFGLLFESVIELGGEGARLRFGGDSPIPALLATKFGRMGAWMARAVQERGARPLELDGRPVVYLFASHLFGADDDDLPAVSDALLGARATFAEAYGAPPWLIGEESPFPFDRDVRVDRRWRARWLDAVTRYHHYDERQARELAPGGGWRLDAEHRRRIVDNEARAVEAFRGTRNELTDAPLLVVPSAAAGFAKQGMPTLVASGSDYLELLRDLQELTDRHLERDHPDAPGSTRLPWPLVFVGSWNEEFEGHALMPAARNEALVEGSRDGFDWLWAIRRLYGWNHHARDLG